MNLSRWTGVLLTVAFTLLANNALATKAHMGATITFVQAITLSEEDGLLAVSTPDGGSMDIYCENGDICADYGTQVVYH